MTVRSIRKVDAFILEKIRMILSTVITLQKYKSQIHNTIFKSYSNTNGQTLYEQYLHYVSSIKDQSLHLICTDYAIIKLVTKVKNYIKSLRKETTYKKQMKRTLKMILVRGQYTSKLTNYANTYSLGFKRTNSDTQGKLKEWFTLSLRHPWFIQNYISYIIKNFVFKLQNKQPLDYGFGNHVILIKNYILAVHSTRRYKYTQNKINKKREKKKRLYTKMYPLLQINAQSRWNYKSFIPLAGHMESMFILIKRNRRKKVKKFKKIQKRKISTYTLNERVTAKTYIQTYARLKYLWLNMKQLSNGAHN